MKKTVFLIRNVDADSFGGGENYQLRLAEKLESVGFLPMIVTNSRELLKRAKDQRIKTLKPPYIKNQNWSGWRNLLLPVYYGYILRLRKWYEEVFKYYKPEIINVQSRDDYLAATTAAGKFGIRVFWTDHADFRNWILWNVNNRLKNVIGKRIIRMSSKAEKVIFVSERIEEETAKMIYPKSLKNIVVIENGVDDELFRYNSIKETEESFVFMGRVTEEKGVRELLQAFMITRKKYPNATLNIYGDGEIEKFSNLYNGCKEVKFCGKTDKPFEALAKNEVFVLSSYREGLSLSLLEAAMMRKKIITTDVDGNSEVVINGQTGLLVPAKNVEKLAEAMIWLLGHKEKSEKMARNARNHYKEKFDFEKIFKERMLPLYNNNKEEK